MADNTETNPGSGGDTLATDDLTTLNGAASSGVKVQRVKIGYGDDAVHRDASANYPLPVVLTNGADPANQVNPPALTKGTQGANGFSVQPLKDAGRTIVNCATAIAGVTCVAAEALMAMDISRGGVATASATSHAVTSGKRWRIQAIVVGLIATGAAVVSARVSLRFNPAGAATAASPIVATAALSSAPAVAQQGNELVIPIPDGVEFSGTDQIGLSQVCSGTGGTLWASLIGYEY